MALIEKDTFKKIASKVKDKTIDVIHRSLDQHVNLAVTGLSQSGKTAFITSLVNQLINEGNGQPLSFFKPVHDGQFIAAKRVSQTNFHISRFDYDGAIEQLAKEQPQWPLATRTISEMRIAIRYYPKDSILKYTNEMATLYLDITDYPGEWLLDLPMLNQTFEQWSEYMAELLTSEPRAELAQPFLNKLKNIDPLSPVDEQLLAELSHDYTTLLHTFRNDLGLSVIQPGRFILPGELEGAPILQFIPYPFLAALSDESYSKASQDTFIGMLRARYLEYRERIVRQFYQQHFVKFDRQIILADCLSPLNNGAASFHDLEQAITCILESFAYGKSNFLTRLFSPKIDKVLFAATKADHVTAEQHPALLNLLEQLVYKAKKSLSFDALQMKSLAIASIRATEQGQSVYKGKTINVLKGRRLDSNKFITVFPGAVPKRLPDISYFKEKSFNYIAFAPLTSVNEHQVLNNIRMDQALQFLLGDKMK